MSGEGYGEQFEYDEDTEGGDEGIEADETFEASDEGDEADEGIGEADEASDESYLTEADEADEGVGEAEDAEADEGVDEAVSWRTKFRAERNRRAFVQRVAATQRADAARAVTAQRSITNQIKSIQPGGAARVASVGTLQGAGVVTAVLPNGRRSQMRIIPTVAPIREVNRLRSVLLANERRQAVATSRNSRAIRALAVAQASAVKKLAGAQSKSDTDLAKKIVEGHNRLDQRITKELGGGAGSLGKHGKRMMAMLRRQRQRSIMNSVTVATALPFFTAYGKKADPFAKNNLILTGSLLGWLVGDELIDSFAGGSSVAKTGASWWSYLAPIGNGATVYFLLKDKQHERFIGGVTTIPATKLVAVGDKVVIPLTTSAIGEDSVGDFKKASHHAVSFSIVSGDATFSSVIVDGEGNLVFTNSKAAAAETVVAWMVDTDDSAVVTVKT